MSFLRFAFLDQVICEEDQADNFVSFGLECHCLPLFDDWWDHAGILRAFMDDVVTRLGDWLLGLIKGVEFRQQKLISHKVNTY